jgi:hypothetical protein
VSPYVRTVKTSSGATAVQIVYSSHRGSRDIEHLGSARDGAQVELLKAAARQRLAAGQGELDLGLGTAAWGGPLPITSSRMAHLWDALAHAYRVLGLDEAAGGDAVFAQLVLARIIEPTSKLDSARVLEETGISARRTGARICGSRCTHDQPALAAASTAIPATAGRTAARARPHKSRLAEGQRYHQLAALAMNTGRRTLPLAAPARQGWKCDRCLSPSELGLGIGKKARLHWVVYQHGLRNATAQRT